MALFAIRIVRSLGYAFFRLRRATPMSPTIEPMPSSASEDGSGTVFSVIASDSEEPLWLTLIRSSAGVGSYADRVPNGVKIPMHEEVEEIRQSAARLRRVVAVNVP